MKFGLKFEDWHAAKNYYSIMIYMYLTITIIRDGSYGFLVAELLKENGLISFLIHTESGCDFILVIKIWFLWKLITLSQQPIFKTYISGRQVESCTSTSRNISGKLYTYEVWRSAIQQIFLLYGKSTRFLFNRDLLSSKGNQDQLYS